jgi:hypothetical protein
MTCLNTAASRHAAATLADFFDLNFLKSVFPALWTVSAHRRWNFQDRILTSSLLIQSSQTAVEET